MLFGPTAREALLLATTEPARRTLVLDLVDAFSKAFPAISYDVYWDTRTANAQAFTLHGRQHVRLMGGLARHVRVSEAGLAWTLAHETGHHLATGAPHPNDLQVRDEAAADAWAPDGLRIVFGEAVGHNYADRGARDMNAFRLDLDNFDQHT